MERVNMGHHLFYSEKILRENRYNYFKVEIYGTKIK